MREIDHVLLVGFGGPDQPGDVKPFLENVARGRKIPKERLDEVLRHYELVGGKSPYNGAVHAAADHLSRALKAEKIDLPVYFGMRNWRPFLKDTFRQIYRQSHRRGVAIILAPFRSEASCQRYKQNVEAAKSEAGQGALTYDYLPAWFDHPSFLEAHSDSIRRAVEPQALSGGKLRFIFTAHSIPESMNESCDHCCYDDEFKKAALLIANKLQLSDWETAYQSRSGNPRDPWLGPDILEVIAKAGRDGKKMIVVIPVGFFCENVEIKYDLDWEAKNTAAKAGLDFIRVPTVSNHPQVIELFKEMIASRVRSPVAK